jgi:hypothetical protein
MVVPSRGDFFILSFCVVCFVFVNIYIYLTYYPRTGNVESSVPLMLGDNDDCDITNANTKYYIKQCMHLFYFGLSNACFMCCFCLII